jgi:ABC-type lipoprotein export system ATPase subunit
MTVTVGIRSHTGGDAPDDAVIELQDVFCVHRTDEGDAAALQGTTLAVTRGELVCVLGPSGAGKSTLLRVIAGLQAPSAGIVRVLDRDIGRLPARVRARLRHRKVGFLGQHADALLSPDLRVRDVIALPLAVRGVRRRAVGARVRELLSAAGLGERDDALTDELSGGERQRVALCAALAHRPELLLADEPTGELDPASAEQVRVLIAALARGEGTTVLIVSHDPASASFADRSVRMRDGRVVEDRGARGGGLVIGRGGWLHLPPDLVSAAGIGSRVRVQLAGEGLLVSPAGTAEGPQRPSNERSPASVPDERDWGAATLELRSVSRSRGGPAQRRTVIDALSATVAPQRLTVIRGVSGAGKTTLVRLLAGLDRPDSGELLLDGAALGKLDAEHLAAVRRERIGYLPQEPNPVGFLSAEENVVLALRLRGWSPRAAAERAAVVLSWVGLSDRQLQRVSRLSGGETQRVALARALASARGLLIVDEPTSRLDRVNARAVAELLATAAGIDSQTVVCATHDPDLIDVADAVIEL